MKFSSKDFNFFDKFNKTRQHAQRRIELFAVLAFFVLFVSVCGVVVSYTIRLQMQAVQYEIESLVMYLENPDTISRLNENAELNQRLEQITLYNRAAKAFNERLMETPAINTYLMQSITDNITTDTSVVTIASSAGAIEIVGKSASEISIAQFLNNMSNLPYVERAFISNISKDDAGCNFAMSIKTKEVASIENIGNE